MIHTRQFSLIKTVTKTRVDPSLKLKDKETTRRLEGSGPFGAMCTHPVKLASTDDIDDELVASLTEAYAEA